MSKESRLCYHAVPKIMQTDITWINAPLEDDSDSFNTNELDDNNEIENLNHKKRRVTINDDEHLYNDAFSEDLWKCVIEKERWKPFADYICDCRINVNVRQVLQLGEQTLNTK